MLSRMFSLSKHSGHTTSDAKGNSIKGSGSVRTLAGFATSGLSQMSAETCWPIYKNYWNDDSNGFQKCPRRRESNLRGLPRGD